MKNRRVVVAVLLVLLLAAGAALYHFRGRGKPLYGQVVFGPDGGTRVWLVLDGDSIYLDDSGGDSPRKTRLLGRSPVEEPVELAGPDGRRYTISRVSTLYTPKAVAAGRQQALFAQASIDGVASFHQYADLALHPDPRRASQAHFDGPLVLQLPGEEYRSLTLAPGGEPADLRVIVGTFRPEVGCWAVVCSNAPSNPEAYAFPPRVVPVLDVEFPPGMPGGTGVKRRFELDKFC